MIQLETITPAQLAKKLGWAEKRLRSLAKKLGACRVLGNRMVFLPEDVTAIMEATRPCPLKSTSEAVFGTIAGQLPDIDYEDRLAQRIAKQRPALRPRSRTDNTNVVPMQSIKR
jgi:hypothetical protein